MGVWTAFEDLLGARPEPKLRPIPGHRAGIPAKDDDFVSTLQPLPGVDIDGVSIGILYRDASGTPSTRTIRCKQALRDGNLIYIHAWCLSRQDWRTFRVDRIVEIYDYTTGELLGRAAPFFSALLGIDLADPQTEAMLPAYFRDGGRVLLYVAMEDGELHPAEMNVVIEFAVRRLRQSGISIKQPDRIAQLWMGNQVPTRQSALAALRKLADDDAYAADVADTMIEVMLADGKVEDAEMEAAWAIVRGLERADKRRAKLR
jgi:hypothetical protein